MIFSTKMCDKNHVFLNICLSGNTMGESYLLKIFI